MQKSVLLAAALALGAGGEAGAYEYLLQFTPNPGARGLTVVGYGFTGNRVFGACSYYVVSGGGSGRGGGYHSHTTRYNQICLWDLFGGLVSVAPGAPTAPAPLSTTGGVTIYTKSLLA
jgi:hypothetical protein